MQLVLRVLLWGPDARPVTALAAAAPPYMGDRAWLELGPGSMGGVLTPAPKTDLELQAQGQRGGVGGLGLGLWGSGVRGQGTGHVTLGTECSVTGPRFLR